MLILRYFHEESRQIHSKLQLADNLASFSSAKNTSDINECLDEMKIVHNLIDDLNALVEENVQLHEEHSKFKHQFCAKIAPPSALSSRVGSTSDKNLINVESTDGGISVSVGSVDTVAVVECRKTKPENLVKDKQQNVARSNLAMKNCSTVKCISDSEFENVPAYMKGQAKLAQINQIVERMNNAFEEKYALLGKGLKGQSTREGKDKFLRYKDQEIDETKHQRFCTDQDLKSILSGKDFQIFCKHVRQILRHCKRFREIRTGGIVRYVLLPH